MKLRALSILSLGLLISCAAPYKIQPVEISITYDMGLNITTLTIDPNGSLEIPGYWDQDTNYLQNRNAILLMDSMESSLIVGKYLPEYSLHYSDEMNALQCVNASYEFEKNVITDLGESYDIIVNDTIQHFIITLPSGGRVGRNYGLLGAKEGFCYVFTLSNTDLTGVEQIDFLTNLYVEN